MRFLPLDWTLLDPAEKAGKTDLNGGTPVRATSSPKITEGDRSPLPRDFRFADGSVAVPRPLLVFVPLSSLETVDTHTRDHRETTIGPIQGRRNDSRRN